MSGWLKIWMRRIVTIGGYTLLWLLMIIGLPLWLMLAFFADMFRRNRWAMIRAILIATVFLSCEMIGIAASLLIWLFSFVWIGGGERKFLQWNFALQQWWAGALFSAAQRIYGLKLEITGEEINDGPVIVFIRHTSLADTLLPSALFSRRQGLVLRYVLKRELLWDPCLDIVGNRLPNAFVERGTGKIAGGVAAVKRLMSGLTDRDGILIYPEGTRFTPTKQAKVLARLSEKGDQQLYEKARALKFVLPPKLSGPLALLEQNENADAIFCVHTGLERANTARDLLDGRIVGQTVRVNCWRVPFAEIPQRREERINWLFEHWAKVDDWVGRQGQ